MYGLQHRALAHTKQQAIKGPRILTVIKSQIDNKPILYQNFHYRN